MKALEANPNNENAYFNAGLARYDLNDFNKAIENFKQAIELKKILPLPGGRLELVMKN